MCLIWFIFFSIRCGYCNEEIYTRYAATYHNKYKHPGEPRNFIKDEQDVSIYYVNRAKKGNSGSSAANPGSFSMNNNNNEDESHLYGVVGKLKKKINDNLLLLLY
jgi:hypothetical protein